jgi:hypothetical protein
MQDQKLLLFDAVGTKGVTLVQFILFIHFNFIVFEVASAKKRLHNVCDWE